MGQGESPKSSYKPLSGEEKLQCRQMFLRNIARTEQEKGRGRAEVQRERKEAHWRKKPARKKATPTHLTATSYKENQNVLPGNGEKGKAKSGGPAKN